MGVPITFLDKYCPEQFEILGMCENLDLYHLKTRIYNKEECQKAYKDKHIKINLTRMERMILMLVA